ncbi:uncharacterized protein LOC144448463 [Glandiceps talaboti]
MSKSSLGCCSCLERKLFLNPSPKCILFVILFVGVIAIATLHYKVTIYLPIKPGRCYLTDNQMDDFRFILKATTKVLDEMNITYWLDYGTLIGAIRNGDVMRHDSDGDITIITNQSYKEMKEKLKQVGIYLTDAEGFHRARLIDDRNQDINLHVDIFSSNVVEGLCDQKPCKKVAMTRDSRSKLDTAIIEHETIPLSWIIPERIIDFADFKVKIPNRAEDVLKNRYPLTYRWTIPYKIQCWLPW